MLFSPTDINNEMPTDTLNLNVIRQILYNNVVKLWYSVLYVTTDIQKSNDSEIKV